jgi:hypothetical protein
MPCRARTESARDGVRCKAHASRRVPICLGARAGSSRGVGASKMARTLDGQVVVTDVAVWERR